MAVVETIKIQGDGTQLDATIDKLTQSVEELNNSIQSIGVQSKKAFDKTEQSVEGVRKETEKTNNSFKELANSAKGLALVSVAMDTAKEAFTANQAVVDVFNTALGAIQLSVSRIFDSITKGTALNLGSVISDSREIVELEKQGAKASALRGEIQLKYQLDAEKARQTRDNETISIVDRIEANGVLNEVLTEQIEKEKELVQQVVAAAQAQFDKIPSLENEIGLIQARTELIDIEERVAGQRSEFLMNQMSLNRELQDYNLLLKKNGEVIYENDVVQIGLYKTRRAQLDAEYKANESLLSQEIKLAKIRIDNTFQGTVAAQEAFGEYSELVKQKGELDAQYARDSKALDQEVTAARFQLAKDGLAAIGALSAAFAGEDEASKKRQFEFQKKLSLASAVVSGVEAVQNAYKTAQASPFTAVFPGYPLVQAGLAAAFAGAQVATIARTQFESPDTNIDTGGGGFGAPAESQMTPQFNIVGRSGINQLAESVNARNQQPIQAYVVAGEVTNAQQLARRRARTATFG